MHTVAKYLMELTLPEAEFSSFVPSQVAAAALYLTMKLLGRGSWVCSSCVRFVLIISTPEHFAPLNLYIECTGESLIDSKRKTSHCDIMLFTRFVGAVQKLDQCTSSKSVVMTAYFAT